MNYYGAEPLVIDIDAIKLALPSMSQRERNEAYENINEAIRRRDEERICWFEPTEPPFNNQREFLESDYRVKFVFGGNRSGKTEIGAAEVVLFALGKHPVWSKKWLPPVYGRICAPKYVDGCKGVILKKLRQFIPVSELKGASWEKAWNEQDKKLTFKNKSTFTFKSGEQDLNTYGGDDLHFVWIDEHLDEMRFLENFARLTDYCGFCLITMTPEAGQTWEFDFIENPPDGVTARCWYFNTADNPHLSAKAVEEFAATIRDPRLRDAKLHGKPVNLHGSVYPMWDPSIVSVPDTPELRNKILLWEKHCLIDPHLRKFTAILWTAWSPDGEVVVYRTVKMKDTVERIAQRIRAESAGEKIEMWIGDEAMGGDGLNIFGERSVLEQLGEMGLPFMGTNQSSDKSFETGVNKVMEYITPDEISGKCKLKILDSLNTGVDWIDGKRTGSVFWEFGRYRFKKEQKSDEETFREKVATVDDDYLDLLRYDVMAGPSGFGELVMGSDIMGGHVRDKDPFTGW